MTDTRSHNREAWNRQVERGNPWTIPVSSAEIAEARLGNWRIILTPSVPVPREWYPPLDGAGVLCLASGGGQQGPILAAAGGDVTVFDNSPGQLAQDRMVAERDGLTIRTVEGDMRDLSCFGDGSFDLIVHPVSNTFVADVRPVWREAHRVLKPGACMLSGFDNPTAHIFDYGAYDRGELRVVNPLPFSEAATLTEEGLAERRRKGEPVEFGHTLDDLLGGQLDAGFAIVGFYEDRYPETEGDLLSAYMGTFMATRSRKAA